MLYLDRITIAVRICFTGISGIKTDEYLQLSGLRLICLCLEPEVIKRSGINILHCFLPLPLPSHHSRGWVKALKHHPPFRAPDSLVCIKKRGTNKHFKKVQERLN